MTVVALAVVLTVSGCAASDAPGDVTPTGAAPAPAAPAAPSTTTAPALPPATATHPAEPGPEPTATCGTVLTPEEYSSLARDSLVLKDDPQPFDDVMTRMLAEGALGCQWAGQGDVMVWFAQQDMDNAEWTTRRAELAAVGYSESNDPFPGTLLGPDDADANFIPSVHYADGVLYYVSYSPFLNSVLALK